MRKRFDDNDALPAEELIASFGEARLVKTRDDKFEIRGGSAEDQAQAREWMEMFLLPPKSSGPAQRQ
jgi:hypothetical protein